MKTDWWMPEKLLQSERLQRESADVDPHSDFGSYKQMLISDSISQSMIRSHNEVYPSYRATIIKQLVGEINVSTILDVCCGLGFTTNSLRNIYKTASVVGVDISKDAVSYAQIHFPKCSFICQAIDPKNGLTANKYDLICAIEFYPFTRTGDYQINESYMAYLLSMLTANGRLVIWQKWGGNESMSTNYQNLKSTFSDYQFNDYQLPLTKVSRIFKKYYNLALAISKILLFIAKPIATVGNLTNRCVIISRRV